jgi:hypothetical protein
MASQPPITYGVLGSVRPAPRTVLGCALRVLFLTSGWGIPLLAASILAGAVLAGGWRLILLMSAVWISYAAHETGHVLVSRVVGDREDPLLLVRRGPTVRVVSTARSARDSRRIALGGPALGVLAAAAITAPGWLFGPSGPAFTVLALAAAVHVYNLAPWTPDGRHVWLRQDRHRF